MEACQHIFNANFVHLSYILKFSVLFSLNKLNSPIGSSMIVFQHHFFSSNLCRQFTPDVYSFMSLCVGMCGCVFMSLIMHVYMIVYMIVSVCDYEHDHWNVHDHGYVSLCVYDGVNVLQDDHGGQYDDLYVDGNSRHQ